MSVKKCEIVNEFISDKTDEDIQSFRIETDTAIGAAIGYPSKREIKRIQNQIYSENNKFKKSKLKNELKLELNRYDSHLKLFDLLSDYTLESGEMTQYEVYPQQIIEDWKIYLTSRGWGEISPQLIMTSKRAAKSIYNRVLAVNKKREKIIKKGKLNKREVGLFKPEIIGITSDRFGVMMKTIKKALRISENEINSYADNSRAFTEATTKFTSFLEEMLEKTVNNIPIFNLNNASLWGIDGFTTTKGTKVLLVGEQDRDYVVKEWDEDMEEYKDEELTIPKENLRATKSDINKELIKQYTNHFMNEVLGGYTRYVEMATIPPEFETDEDGDTILKNGKPVKSKLYIEFRKKWRGEGSSFDALLEEMRMDSEHNEDNNGKRVTPNVHEASDIDNDYRYIMLFDKDESAKQNKKIYRSFLISKRKKGDNPDTGKSYEWENLLDNGYDMSVWDNIFDANGNSMQNGWMRASDEFNFGRMRNKNGVLIEGSHRKALRNFTMIENQPPSEILDNSIIEAGAQYNNFWDTVSAYEQEYKKISIKASKMLRDNNAKIELFRKNLEKKLKAQGKSADEISEYIKQLLSIGGIQSRVYTKELKDINGEIIDTQIYTPTTFFNMKSFNYLPHMYKDKDLLEMADMEISNMEGELAELDDDSKEYKDLKKAIEYLKIIKDKITGNVDDNDADVISKLTEAQTNVFVKHRTAWTDGMRRRTDNGIHSEYLKRLFSNLHRTDLVSETMSSIDKLLTLEKNRLVPEGSIDYLVNRVKMAVGDSNTRSTSFITGRESGYEELAKRLNTVLPEWLKAGTKHTAESAERLTKWVTSIPTQRFLGSSTAIGNLTQIMNQIVANGWGTFWEAQKAMNNKFDKKWDVIVEKTGVLNIMSMFQDIMLQGGDVDWNDFGFLPGTILPSRNMTDWFQMLRKGKENFIKSKDKDLEEFLMKIEYRNKGLVAEKIKDVRELAAKKRKLNKERDELLKQKKGQMWDILMHEKEGNIKDLENLMVKFMGELSDTKLKQMVSWKLSWQLDLTKGMRDFLTFSGTETNLRKLTAIMALMDAKKRGLLGGDVNEDESSIYTSPRAIKIARDAVYQSQFGMTSQYVGEGFNGLGRAIWQYKIYPTSQIEHDYNVIRRFTEGSDNSAESVMRISIAIKDAILRLAKGKTKSYDPKDKTLDHEALAVGRLVFSRFLASAVASLISVVPIIPWYMRSMGSQGFSMLRSAENPAVGIAMRIATWSLFAMMGADDDDNDKRLEQIIQQFSFLFLPVWIGMVGRDLFTAYEGSESVGEWFR